MIACALLLPLQTAPPAQSPVPPVIDLGSLLRELTDRRELARLPSPSRVCRQASSYDRASVTPDKEGWFANGDAGQYLRMEERDGRTEGVMLDADGPGAITRIWSANPAGVLRIRLDGAEEPVIAEDMTRLLSGAGPVVAPLSHEASSGHNLYLPIPYAQHCKVTCDAPKDVYYQIGYLTWPSGTAVK